MSKLLSEVLEDGLRNPLAFDFMSEKRQLPASLLRKVNRITPVTVESTRVMFGSEFIEIAFITSGMAEVDSLLFDAGSRKHVPRKRRY